MYPATPQQKIQQYQVRVGHTRVTVSSATPEEAIRLARRQLCQELPRMWDVIHRMEDSQFQVERLN